MYDISIMQYILVHVNAIQLNPLSVNSSSDLITLYISAISVLFKTHVNITLHKSQFAEAILKPWVYYSYENKFQHPKHFLRYLNQFDKRSQLIMGTHHNITNRYKFD